MFKGRNVTAERERRRKESSAGLELPNFEVGDDVLYDARPN